MGGVLKLIYTAFNLPMSQRQRKTKEKHIGTGLLVRAAIVNFRLCSAAIHSGKYALAPSMVERWRNRISCGRCVAKSQG